MKTLSQHLLESLNGSSSKKFKNGDKVEVNMSERGKPERWVAGKIKNNKFDRNDELVIKTGDSTYGTDVHAIEDDIRHSK